MVGLSGRLESLTVRSRKQREIIEYKPERVHLTREGFVRRGEYADS